MPPRALSDEDRRRLADERIDADRRYNDALTALDEAVASPPTLTIGLPPVDEPLLPAINERSRATAGPTFPRGWRGRAARFVWRLIAPIVERQQQFNAIIAEHVNRTIERERRTQAAQREVMAAVRDQLAAIATFESRAVQLLQHVTAYVDTKDREVAAAAAALPHEQARALEQTVGLVQQQLTAMRREIERLAAMPGATMTGEAESLRSRSSGMNTRQASGSEAQREVSNAGKSSDMHLAGYKYVAFQDEFRGDPSIVRTRLESYAPLFEGARDVLDVGCGRGEFLEILRARGIGARGVEANPEMAALCRSKGLDVEEGDAVGCLERLPDGALGGLFAAQVVEHLEPAYLMRLLDLAYLKLRPGSRIVLETINVDCWSAFFGPYLRDITHVRPLPPETLGYLLRASGFQRVETRAASPVDPAVKLRMVSAAGIGHDALRTAVDALNHNAEALNALLFTHMDYAAIAERL